MHKFEKDIKSGKEYWGFWWNFEFVCSCTYSNLNVYREVEKQV